MTLDTRVRALAAATLTLLAAACGDGATAVRDQSAALAPSTKPSFGYALPRLCDGNVPGACTGVLATDELPHEEQLKVCKKYPAGTVNPPAVVVQLDAYSPDSASKAADGRWHEQFTIQPNTCRILWQNGEVFPENGGTKLKQADQVTVTEIVPAGYTTQSQVTRIIATEPTVLNHHVYATTVDAPTSSASASGIVGGYQIPGMLVVFTNTPIPPGAIGDFVWDDTNANGVQDAGEPGIAGATVALSNGMSAVTGANGAYAITGIAPGTYTVTVTTPAGYAASPTGAGTAATDNNGSGTSVTVVAGATDNTIDFGFYRTATLGDRVWNDLNANGIQDAGEPGIPGVTVALSGGATTTTDASGLYAFTNLTPGSYAVSVTLPNGCVASPTGAGNSTNDSDASGGSVTLASGATNTTIDFGCYYRGNLGDLVWNDLNGNGLQDAGEPGLAGITVTLGNGQSTTTNASGIYAFTNLLVGTYTVTLATPSGYNASPSNVGANDAIDSDGSGTTAVVTANTTNATVDFGFVAISRGPGCTLTQGYWKNHEEDWAAPYSPNAQWLSASHKVVGVTWDELMSMPPKGGNSYLQLAHQWIAATLNGASGASMSPSVKSAFDAAGAWLLANTPASTTSVPSIKSAQADAWMTTLDNYNNGKLGTPHCN